MYDWILILVILGNLNGATAVQRFKTHVQCEEAGKAFVEMNARKEAFIFEYRCIRQ